MRLPRVILSLLLLLLTIAVAVDVAARRWRDNATAAALPTGAIVDRDIAYGSDPAQRLDVYRLPGGGALKPIIVMVHGGAWRNGDKNGPGVAGNKVARWLPQGYVFVSINYRMLPAQDALQQVDDVARALAYVQKHALEWGGDRDKLVLMGHSAGAHLIALLSADPERAQAFGASRWSASVALDSAALDVVSLMQRRHLGLYDPAFGTDPARWRQASPLHVLGAKAVPLLAVCSTQRRDRPCDQAGAYAERSRALGVAAEVSGQDLNHAQINRDLGLPGAYTAQVERFMAAPTAR